MKKNSVDKFATTDRKKQRDVEPSAQHEGRKKLLDVLRIALPVFIVILVIHLAVSVVTLTSEGEDFISSGGRIGTIEAIYVKGFLGFFSIIIMGLVVFWCAGVLFRLKLKTIVMLSAKILLLWFFLSMICGLLGLDAFSGIVGDFLAASAQRYLGGVGAWLFTFGFFMLYLWFMIGVDHIAPIIRRIRNWFGAKNQQRMEEKAQKREELMKEYQEKTRERYKRRDEVDRMGTINPGETPIDIPDPVEKRKADPIPVSTGGYGTFSIDVSKFLEKQEKLRKERERIDRETLDLTGNEYDLPASPPPKPETAGPVTPALAAVQQNIPDMSSELIPEEEDLSDDDFENETVASIPSSVATTIRQPLQQEVQADVEPEKHAFPPANQSPNIDQAVSEGLEKAREIAIKSTLPPKTDVKLSRGDANDVLDGQGIYFYEQPSLNNLDEPDSWGFSVDEQRVHEQSLLLEETLAHFKITGDITRVTPGPVITRFEYRPEKGIKISKISSLTDDLAMALKAVSIRIIAPIPGKDVVGIEIPNPKRKTVTIKEIVLSEEFRDTKASLPLALGSAVDGRPVVTDLAKAPHLLVAGATGSGKSVCVNTIITSLVYSQTPSNLRLLMIDPKRLELSVYRDLPFMISEPIVEPEDAVLAFNWAVEEMTSRYRMLADIGVRDLKEFNRKVKANPDLEMEPLPRIVVIVDELADLMMTSASQIEEPIARLAQMARAVGIHLILATQRPSVDVLTGLIKANFPSRIAFTVRSQIDSRTIIDMAGAEKLLGYGDMLFLNSSLGEPMRIHGSLVTTEETERLVQELSNYRCPYEMEEFKAEEATSVPGMDGSFDDSIVEASKLVVINQKGSASMLQRKMRIGYNRAGSLIDQMEFLGIVGPSQGSKPREVRVRDIDELIEILSLRGLS